MDSFEEVGGGSVFLEPDQHVREELDGRSERLDLGENALVPRQERQPATRLAMQDQRPPQHEIRGDLDPASLALRDGTRACRDLNAQLDVATHDRRGAGVGQHDGRPGKVARLRPGGFCE